MYVSGFFDADMKLNVQRRKLPHWTQEKVIYFVTFRLSDSLPVQKLEALNEEKTRWLATNPLPHNDRQIKEYHRNFSRRIHDWLDAGYGSCLLARPEIRRIIDGALNFFDGKRYAELDIAAAVQSKEHTRPACKFDDLKLCASIGTYPRKLSWPIAGFESLWLGRLTRGTRMLRYCGIGQSAHKRRPTAEMVP